MALEHLLRARRELREAQEADDAGAGTELMVAEVIEDLNRLIRTTRNNKEDE